MRNTLIEKGISRKSRKEEMNLDLYVYTEMKKLGYDIYAFDNSSTDSKYNKCADKAIECLVAGKSIPEDIRQFFLNEKEEREKDKRKEKIGYEKAN